MKRAPRTDTLALPPSCQPSSFLPKPPQPWEMPELQEFKGTLLQRRRSRPDNHPSGEIGHSEVKSISSSHLILGVRWRLWKQK